MSWLSLYFNVSNKNVFVLGTGEVASRRAIRFLDKGANVILAGDKLNNSVIEKGGKLIKIFTDLYKFDKDTQIKYMESNKKIIKEEVEKADFVIIATGDYELADYTSLISKGKLLNRADKTDDGNIIVPTSFYIDDVEFSIFTGGKSPLMAKKLRQKIQSIITDEDILEIKIQDYARKELKTKIENPKLRKKVLYEILNDSNIKNSIKDKNIDKIKIFVDEIINNNI
ncbi:siroheme synthase [Methanobrevibacter sp. 87.7]|uniref:precorrin-2 dehydrogenase/sirohydrochlorin ferrochelatase family protein n=1 Tax=Methanobrevibacter sp. 87.7 TaxID=387957 RepID=UPI000B5036A2|nr:bifunctional precorrin-2 dehydrogenase/sirohydrochlorin ferrochelatase [Methanobrevibacter sp. 87.7]OWT32881.1 siroheme synthase [Methanobrevibacter sp. 87.7]